MSLAVFLKTHEHAIVEEWGKFAQKCRPAAQQMDKPMLRDHIHELLQSIVHDLQHPALKEREREEKAQCEMSKEEYDIAALTHGRMRFESGFNIIQVHLEFCALRASIIKLWSQDWTRSNREWATPAQIVPELIILNDAVDKMVSDSLSSYISQYARQVGAKQAPIVPENAQNLPG